MFFFVFIKVNNLYASVLHAKMFRKNTKLLKNMKGHKWSGIENISVQMLVLEV
jgi:hypothetical protein